jgi:hypothetical protein
MGLMLTYWTDNATSEALEQTVLLSFAPGTYGGKRAGNARNLAISNPRWLAVLTRDHGILASAHAAGSYPSFVGAPLTRGRISPNSGHPPQRSEMTRWGQRQTSISWF